jgi:hypothetical protein
MFIALWLAFGLLAGTAYIRQASLRPTKEKSIFALGFTAAAFPWISRLQ